MGKRSSKQAPVVPYMNLNTPSASGDAVTVQGGVRLDKASNRMYTSWIKTAKQRFNDGLEPKVYTFEGSVWIPEMGTQAYDEPE